MLCMKKRRKCLTKNTCEVDGEALSNLQDQGHQAPLTAASPLRATDSYIIQCLQFILVDQASLTASFPMKEHSLFFQSVLNHKLLQTTANRPNGEASENFGSCGLGAQRFVFTSNFRPIRRKTSS
ncbi:unnamed protein product, partial [Nesidiocoris tenuis]